MDKSFAKNVLDGLTAPDKHLSSKYFYDLKGSRIFREIMEMPSYYLTNAEFEILSRQAESIVQATQFSEAFNIMEMGAGDGSKTFKLLEYLVAKKVEFTYIPIDISSEAIKLLVSKLNERLPGLSIRPMVGDYFKILNDFSKETKPSLLLFLGSNIGNYNTAKAIDLLRLFNASMNLGDKLLIGMDLKKNPNIIRLAYNDPQGITKRFNLNLLTRINTEFEADFNIEEFDFYCQYDPFSGDVKSYLVSLKQQDVFLKTLNTSIHFEKDEIIWTELSKKYSVSDIEELALSGGFKVKKNFFDSSKYFTDSLWEKTGNFR